MSKNSSDPLLDRDCVILDGKCDCPRPVFKTCKKYLTKKDNSYIIQENSDAKGRND